MSDAGLDASGAGGVKYRRLGDNIELTNDQLTQTKHFTEHINTLSKNNQVLAHNIQKLEKAIVDIGDQISAFKKRSSSLSSSEKAQLGQLKANYAKLRKAKSDLKSQKDKLLKEQSKLNDKLQAHSKEIDKLKQKLKKDKSALAARKKLSESRRVFVQDRNKLNKQQLDLNTRIETLLKPAMQTLHKAKGTEAEYNLSRMVAKFRIDAQAHLIASHVLVKYDLQKGVDISAADLENHPNKDKIGEKQEEIEKTLEALHNLETSIEDNLGKVGIPVQNAQRRHFDALQKRFEKQNQELRDLISPPKPPPIPNRPRPPLSPNLSQQLPQSVGGKQPLTTPASISPPPLLSSLQTVQTKPPSSPVNVAGNPPPPPQRVQTSPASSLAPGVIAATAAPKPDKQSTINSNLEMLGEIYCQMIQGKESERAGYAKEYMIRLNQLKARDLGFSGDPEATDAFKRGVATREEHLRQSSPAGAPNAAVENASQSPRPKYETDQAAKLPGEEIAMLAQLTRKDRIKAADINLKDLGRLHHRKEVDPQAKLEFDKCVNRLRILRVKGNVGNSPVFRAGLAEANAEIDAELEKLGVLFYEKNSRGGSEKTDYEKLYEESLAHLRNVLGFKGDLEENPDFNKGLKQAQQDAGRKDQTSQQPSVPNRSAPSPATSPVGAQASPSTPPPLLRTVPPSSHTITTPASPLASQLLSRSSPLHASPFDPQHPPQRSLYEVQPQPSSQQGPLTASAAPSTVPPPLARVVGASPSRPEASPAIQLPAVYIDGLRKRLADITDELMGNPRPIASREAVLMEEYNRIQTDFSEFGIAINNLGSQVAYLTNPNQLNQLQNQGAATEQFKSAKGNVFNLLGILQKTGKMSLPGVREIFKGGEESGDLIPLGLKQLKSALPNPINVEEFLPWDILIEKRSSVDVAKEAAASPPSSPRVSATPPPLLSDVLGLPKSPPSPRSSSPLQASPFEPPPLLRSSPQKQASNAADLLSKAEHADDDAARLLDASASGRAPPSEKRVLKFPDTDAGRQQAQAAVKIAVKEMNKDDFVQLWKNKKKEEADFPKGIFGTSSDDPVAKEIRAEMRGMLEAVLDDIAPDGMMTVETREKLEAILKETPEFMAKIRSGKNDYYKALGKRLNAAFDALPTLVSHFPSSPQMTDSEHMKKVITALGQIVGKSKIAADLIVRIEYQDRGAKLESEAFEEQFKILDVSRSSDREKMRFMMHGALNEQPLNLNKLNFIFKTEKNLVFANKIRMRKNDEYGHLQVKTVAMVKRADMRTAAKYSEFLLGSDDFTAFTLSARDHNKSILSKEVAQFEKAKKALKIAEKSPSSLAHQQAKTQFDIAEENLRIAEEAAHEAEKREAVAFNAAADKAEAAAEKAEAEKAMKEAELAEKAGNPPPKKRSSVRTPVIHITARPLAAIQEANRTLPLLFSETIATEYSFANGLNIVAQVGKSNQAVLGLTYQSTPDGDIILTKDGTKPNDLQSLFIVSNQILIYSKKMAKKLNDFREKGITTNELLDFYKSPEWLGYVKAMNDYAPIYNSGIAMLDALCEKNKDFAEAVQLNQLKSFFITPIQRLPRYVLLMKEFQKKGDLATNFLDIPDKAAKDVNEKVRGAELRPDKVS